METKKSKPIPKDKWVWMPHPGHLCVSRDCKFHLNTYVGDYIVSTVGEYFPDRDIRQIFANSRKVQIEGKGDAWDADYMRKIGYEDIGAGRKYETMVFKAGKAKDKCCPYTPSNWVDIDSASYNDPGEALQGHLRLCRKWAKRRGNKKGSTISNQY